MNTEDIREGAIYRTMADHYVVESIVEGKVHVVRQSDQRTVDLAVEHFAQIAEMEVRVKEPTDVVVG